MQIGAGVGWSAGGVSIPQLGAGTSQGGGAGAAPFSLSPGMGAGVEGQIPAVQEPADEDSWDSAVEDMLKLINRGNNDKAVLSFNYMHVFEPK